MNTLLTVTLGYDLSMLDRLAASIDYPLTRKIVVGNGCDLSEWGKKHQDWHVWDSPINLGCAGGWNLSPTLIPDFDGAIIVNDDQEFQPGVLEEICTSSDLHLDAPIIHVNEREAYDIFVWNKCGVETIGLFDENFWPAYFEDYDYRNRLKAIGAKPYHIKNYLPVHHGKPRPAGPSYMNLLNAVKPINEAYFNQKWETPPKDVREWELDVKRRNVLRAIWNKHWKGSVYL